MKSRVAIYIHPLSSLSLALLLPSLWTAGPLDRPLPHPIARLRPSATSLLAAVHCLSPQSLRLALCSLFPFFVFPFPLARTPISALLPRSLPSFLRSLVVCVTFLVTILSFLPDSPCIFGRGPEETVQRPHSSPNWDVYVCAD